MAYDFHRRRMGIYSDMKLKTQPAAHLKVDDAEAKRRLIADIAYFAARAPRLAPGYELDDWLEAEQEVEASLEALEPQALEVPAQSDTSHLI